MKYIDADRLREELEKKYNNNDTVGDSWDLGYDTACEQILDIIDSLQQEQPELPQIERAEYYYHKGVYEGLSQGRADALKILDEFMKRKADLGWHSVDDFLPEVDKEVIVLTDELGTAPIYKIAFGHIVDRTRCSDYNGWNIPGVKFWMPFPEIPKEEK